jgi:dTDP-4-dehydrorhamnose reductase
LSSRQRVLIIGGNGQVSTSLLHTLQADSCQVMQVGRPTVDLLEPRTIVDAISRFDPTIVVNAAAYTAVDKAEDEPDLAKAVNATGAEAVAKAAATAGAAVVHFSTDYVFDGGKTTPYVETDPIAPLGIYGQTKALGEQLVAAANPRHVILRTAWVFSPFASNFVRTILRLLSDREELQIVSDQYGTPTYAPDLADVVLRVVQRLAGSADPDCFGVFHAVNTNSTSWFEFARAINAAAARHGATQRIIRPISTKEYPTKARRPAYSVLATDKLQNVYGIRLRGWQDALDDCVDRLFANGTAPSQTKRPPPELGK